MQAAGSSTSRLLVDVARQNAELNINLQRAILNKNNLMVETDNLKKYLGLAEKSFVTLSEKDKAEAGGRLRKLLHIVTDEAFVPLMNYCLEENHADIEAEVWNTADPFDAPSQPQRKTATTAEKLERLMCLDCGKIFQSKCNLRVHRESLHHSLKPLLDKRHLW